MFLRGGMEEEMLNLEVLGVAFEGTIINYISKYEHIIMHNMEVGSLSIVYSINLYAIHDTLLEGGHRCST